MIPSGQIASLVRGLSKTPAGRGRAMQMLRRKGDSAPGFSQRKFLLDVASPNGALVPGSALAAAAEAIAAEVPTLTPAEAMLRAHDLIDAHLPGSSS
jgi:hypothetical protein